MAQQRLGSPWSTGIPLALSGQKQRQALSGPKKYAYEYGKGVGSQVQDPSLLDPKGWLKYADPGTRKTAAAGYAKTYKKPSQTGSGNATGGPAVGQGQAAQRDPRDAQYYAELAKLNFQRQQQIGDLTLQGTYAKEDFEKALAGAREQHPKDLQSANEAYNNQGLFYSGKLGEARGNIEKQYTEGVANAQTSFDRAQAARTAAQRALEQGASLDEAALYAQSVDRQTQSDLNAPAPEEQMPANVQKNGYQEVYKPDGRVIHVYPNGKRVTLGRKWK